jgi:hypothetical protein
MPMVASRPAATVVGMPWSLAAGMKWVPISPLVVIPQIAKLAANNQNAGTLAPTTSPSNAARKLDVGATGSSSSTAPYAVNPLSCG